MNPKYVAMLIVGTLGIVSTVQAKVFETGLFYTFPMKLRLMGGQVYIDSNNSVRDMGDGKVYLIKHVLAFDTKDPNYVKLKQDAAAGKTVTVDGRFSVEPDLGLIFLVANKNGRR